MGLLEGRYALSGFTYQRRIWMIHPRLLVRAQCGQLKSSSQVNMGQSMSSCAVAESTNRKEHGRAARRKYLWNGLTVAESVLFSVLERGHQMVRSYCPFHLCRSQLWWLFKDLTGTKRLYRWSALTNSFQAFPGTDVFENYS